MTNDKLATCPKCKCDGCYVTPVNEVKNNYFCFGCGYQSSDLMIEGEFDFTTYEETLPELYKDLKHTDESKRVWYPITINTATKGTVFIYGTSREDAQWAAIKVVPLTEEEMAEPKYKGASYRSDPKSLKHFGIDFIEACDYIEIFKD